MTYNTAQRKAVIDFLSDNEDKQYTIEEIVTELEKTDFPPGKSSVYRIVASLVGDGVIKRFTSGRKFLYQIIRCKEASPHIHLKCTICGKIFHLDNDTTNSLNALIKAKTDFEVNDENTIIFGVCPKCK